MMAKKRKPQLLGAGDTEEGAGPVSSDSLRTLGRLLAASSAGASGRPRPGARPASPVVTGGSGAKSSIKRNREGGASRRKFASGRR